MIEICRFFPLSFIFFSCFHFLLSHNHNFFLCSVGSGSLITFDLQTELRSIRFWANGSCNIKISFCKGSANEVASVRVVGGWEAGPTQPHLMEVKRMMGKRAQRLWRRSGVPFWLLVCCTAVSHIRQENAKWL